MVAIKDMKMPTCCIDCRMEGGYCRHNHGWLLQNKKDKDCPLRELSDNSVLEDIRAKISEYGSIRVSYTITGHTDKDIQKLVENVLKQAKEEVLNVIDKHMKSKISPIGQAIVDLIENWQNAEKSEYVNKPISYALYHTWLIWDKKETSKKRILQ